MGTSNFEKLARTRRQTAAFNLVLLESYEEVAREFGRRGVRYLPVKGCDLVGTLYDDPGVRFVSDIDVLVHPADLAEAVAAVRQVGYKEKAHKHKLPGVWPSRGFFKEKRGLGIPLDLHYCIGPELARRRLETCRLFRGWEPGARLSAEGRLLTSIIHHQNHFFESSLAGYYETVLLAREARAGRFPAFARRWDAALAASFVLARATYFFGGSAPPGNHRRSALNEVVNLNEERPPKGYGWRSALAFVLSWDGPTPIKFGSKALIDKILKKANAHRKKP